MSARATSVIFVVLSLLPQLAVKSQAPALVETIKKEQQEQVDLYGDPLPPGAVARFGTVRLRHIVRDGSGAARIAFSSDGRRLISCGDVGVRVWDVTTGKRLNDQFSKDDKKLITRIVESQKQGGDFANPSAISPDGKIQGLGNWLSSVLVRRALGAVGLFFVALAVSMTSLRSWSGAPRSIQSPLA